MPTQPKVAIIGLGAIGAMAAWRLAARGVQVTGYDRFAPANSNGASSGETRMFRMAYVEGNEYVPLLQQSVPLWRELEQLSGRTLFQQHGMLSIGRQDHPDLSKIAANAAAGEVPLTQLSAAELRHRFPQWRIDDDEIALLDPQGGLLRPEPAIISAIDEALRLGAEIRTGAAVTGIEETSSGVRISTDSDTTTFDRVLVATGPWASQVLGDLIPAVHIERVASLWFATLHNGEFLPERFLPALRRGDGVDMSVFPSVDGNFVKVNLHSPRLHLNSPDGWDRTVEEQFVEDTKAAVRKTFVGLSDYAVRRQAYQEGFTADGHPLVGPISPEGRVVTITGMSGHGFKFSPIMGEVAADLITEGETDLPIAHMSLTRDSLAS